MTRIVRTPRKDERGAIMIIFALAMVALIGMLAIALDLSYGFVQNRRAQNAADFAAFGVSQQLNGSSTCNGIGATPNMAQVVAMVQDIESKNTSTVGLTWTGTFLDGNGQPLAGGGFTAANNSASSFPPFGACGVAVNASPSWKPFFAGVFGVNLLKGSGNAKAANTGKGTPFGIISLNQSGPHAILGGGTGTFIVNGDIVLNTNVNQQPWTEQHSSWSWDDAIDAKSGSNLSVYGTIHSFAGTSNGQPLWPLDWCFGVNGAGQDQPIQGNTAPLPTDPTYPGATPPLFNPPCSVGSVTVKYNHIDPTLTPIADPLQSTGAPTDPFTAKPTCPGMALQTYNSYSSGNLLPGEYTVPVKVTTGVTFGDCSAYGGSEPAYPGVYLFDKGLWIDPPSGSTVTGANVVLATKAPYNVAGNVGASGSGNGGPCLPAAATASGDTPGSNPKPGFEVDGTTACPGASYGGAQEYGVTAYTDAGPFSQDTTNYGTGDNFSLIIGGAGTVNLTGPTFGGYGGSGNPGLALYQSVGTQANFGFDAQAGDSATINVTGVVYNASLTGTPTWDFWDDGIPFYAGGTLQTGYGAHWSTPTPSSGAVNITGTAIVDDFNTDGTTTIDIQGKPYTLPGGAILSLVG